MFNIDKIIEESNKKMIYGEKPELPQKLDRVPVMNEYGDMLGYREPNEKDIKDTINKIIDYLEWENK